MSKGKGTILYTGGFELPDKNAAALRVIGNAKALRELGYTVVFLGVSKDDSDTRDLFASRNTVEGFDAWHTSYPGQIRQWISYVQDIDGLKTVYHSYQNVKAVICYNYPAMAMMKARHFCHANQVGILSDCTEWYPISDGKWSYKIVKGLDSFWRMRILQKKLDGLIVISSYLERYYKKCKNVILIPPLVDRTEQKWQGGMISSGDRRIRLIYSGATLEGKNKDTIDGLLEALHRFQSGAFLLQVVGMTRTDYLKDFPDHELLLQNLEGTVEFMGRVSHQASIEYVKNADFSILLRNQNRKNNAGFPTKFVESMACGVPVIATDTSDISKYLIDGKNGLWTGNTPDRLLETLNRIALLNPEEIRQMKEACKNTTPFDYHNFIAQFSDLMKRI